MKKTIVFATICLSLSACGSREVKILDANWTSMKHSMPPSPTQNITRVSGVNVEYCVDSWRGTFGLMDEAVKKAENQYEIDYIKYPAFTYKIGTQCMTVSGEGYRVVR